MTAIRGVWGAVQDDGTTPYRNHAEDIRAAVWDQLGRRQGVISGFGMTLDSGSLSVTFAAGSAMIEERGTDINGDSRGYHVFNDETTQVVFDAPDASSRNDAVVFAWADPQYGALGAAVTGEGPQIVVVKGTSGSTTPRTDTQINDEIGVGGWFRFADVIIDNGDTEVNPANVTEANTSAANPSAVLVATSAQTIPDSVLTQVVFGSSETTGPITVSGNQVTIDEPGVYLATFTAAMSSTSAIRVLAEIRLTTAERIARDGDGGGGTSHLRYMSAAGGFVATGGEVVECQLYHEHGASLDTIDFPYPRLTVVKVA